MHVLITGAVGVGKSTLTDKLIKQVKRPVFGFRTKKTEEDASGNARIYIHPATGALIHSDGNAVGLSKPDGADPYPEVFNSIGVRLLTGIPAGAIVLMDELGYLESQAGLFCEAVMRILDGPYHVLAVIKARHTPFLESVRSHKKGKLWTVTLENRDLLYNEILSELVSLDAGSPFLS